MSAPVSFIEWRWSKDCRLKSIVHACLVYDIVLCVYERFRVVGWKRYVNDDRLRVERDKNMRLLAFAFTIVFVWTGPHVIEMEFQPGPKKEREHAHWLCFRTSVNFLTEICVLRPGWNWACIHNNISARWAGRNFRTGWNSPCYQALTCFFLKMSCNGTSRSSNGH